MGEHPPIHTYDVSAAPWRQAYIRISGGYGAQRKSKFKSKRQAIAETSKQKSLRHR